MLKSCFVNHQRTWLLFAIAALRPTPCSRASWTSASTVSNHSISHFTLLVRSLQAHHWLHLLPIVFTDILPLVEFEVDPQLTHEQVQVILGKSNAANAERRSSVNWSEKREDFYSHDSLITENDSDRFNILTANEQVNSKTNLIVLGKTELGKLDPAHLVTITNQYQRDQFEAQYRYFLNMMPEISIIACSHCNKVWHNICWWKCVQK